MKALRLSIVQDHLAWEQKQQNLKHFSKVLSPLKGETDLIVLPEMFTTGFSMNAEKLAETMEGPTVQWLKKQAADLSAAIMGSCIIRDMGKFYNRLLFVTPEGKTFYYDKRHLFSFAGEHEYYTGGTHRILIPYKGWKIMPQICYDLRFPVWSRNTDDYDLLIYVANFPDKRRFAWQQLLTARAIENQVYTIGVNRIGLDENGIEYSGDSVCL
ncbi:MAG: amidohydrolase, partial [Bacteroidetes bacterium]